MPKNNILEITSLFQGRECSHWIDLSDMDILVEDLQLFANACSIYPNRTITRVRRVDFRLDKSSW